MKVKTSPDSNKSDMKRVLPRNRIKYSAQQLHRLEKVFLSTQYPDSSVLEELSSTVSVNVERLSIWFQNRRSKFKRQNKDGHTSWMRQQLYQQMVPQSRAACSQSRGHEGHVLSPPTENRLSEQLPPKPTSNLHYMSTSGSSCAHAPDSDSFRLRTPSTSAAPATVSMETSPESAYNPVLLSHLVQEMAYQQPPYYPLPGYIPSAGTSCPDTQCYPQSYSPYHGGFVSSAVGYPPVGV